MPPDYHMHTPLCHHASGEPTELAAQAVKVGISEIGFTEHNPMIRDDFDDWHMYIDALDDYIERIRKAQSDHPGLAIKFGLEMDFIPGHEDWIRDLASRHSWDYFIGSVHYISDDWDFDNPHKAERWARQDTFEIWSDYFDRLTQSVESGLFEIIGHADLCKKFGHYPDEDCTPLYAKLLDAAARQGVAMELNTAGLRKDCKEIYPSRQIVEMAFERNVPITFGSDAHAIEEVGMNFNEAIALANSVGYTECVRFTKRQREVIPI